jgi:hypothetical protein
MRVAPIVLAFGMFGSAAVAQNPPTPPTPAQGTTSQIPVTQLYRYRLLGVYDRDSGEPVDGVEVTDVFSGTKTTTNKTGTISLFFLPEGGSLVRVRKVGYEMQTFPVSISPNDTLPVTDVIAKATQLPTVVVTDSGPGRRISPGLRGFEERRNQGYGSFVSDEELRKGEDRTLTNIITSKIPGITSVQGPGVARYLTSGRKACAGRAFTMCASSNCYVTVYIDGAKVFDNANRGAAMQLIDFDRLNVQDYAGVEYYASGATTPPQYNATSDGCGTLVLWTKER